MKKILYLHIGYGKAGSTFFQSIFNNKIQFNGIYLRSLNKKNFDITKQIKLVRSNFKNDKINIISDETFTSPFSSKDLNIYNKLAKIFDILNLYFEIKIIAIVRNQKEWLLSRYAQNPLRFMDINHDFYSYKNLLKIYENKNNLSVNINFIRNINYDYMYKFLNKKISKQNIKFLIFEDLTNNSKKTAMNELGKFFKNRYLFKNTYIKKEYYYSTKKIGSYYFPKILFKKFFYIRRRYGLKKCLLIFFYNKFLLPSNSDNNSSVFNFYKNSNINFARKINKNLKKYNYS